MASISLCLIFALSHLFLQLSAEKQSSENCSPYFQCEPFGLFGYPFTTIYKPSCGLFVLNCTQPVQTIGLTSTGPWYDILDSFASNKTFLIGDLLLFHVVDSDKCDIFERSSILPKSSSVNFKILYNETLWKCPDQKLYPDLGKKNGNNIRRLMECKGFKIYHNNDTEGSISGCSVFQYPKALVVQLSDKCSQCVSSKGLCQDVGDDRFRCLKKSEKRRQRLVLGLGLTAASIAIIVLCLVCWHVRKAILKSLPSNERNIREPKRMKTDLDGNNVYSSVPIFSFSELEEATNNFDPSKEIGDGGYGTVYYGKLIDGREVAVKRLYQRNFRRVEQFMNEVEILACLRHKNLVSLYGCTSRRSKELILVYEYVSNGTIADHLHGELAKCGVLTWPIRMSIAIETASALTYLHASDVIHRDVKSNNILLDNNFNVKIADFGLSRLFPMDVTHVSTAPQGTPGYVDPEYHQCYQLTDKSDVYSFGVLLVELISSLPAIDISRREDEINLSSYAMKKIQSTGLDDLVDSRLGYKTNWKTNTMISSMAELAFRCLQQKRELRPTMAEVLEELKRIESAGCDNQITAEKEQKEEDLKTRTECDKISLLRGTEDLPSSNSVTQKWGSSKTSTPPVSTDLQS